MGGFARRSFRGESEYVGFVGFKDISKVLDQLLILSRSEEGEEAAACL